MEIEDIILVSVDDHIAEPPSQSSTTSSRRKDYRDCPG